jgi:hypothetical protein
MVDFREVQYAGMTNNRFTSDPPELYFLMLFPSLLISGKSKFTQE